MGRVLVGGAAGGDCLFDVGGLIEFGDLLWAGEIWSDLTRGGATWMRGAQWRRTMCSPGILEEEAVAGRVSEWDLVTVGEVEEPGIGGTVSRAWTALHDNNVLFRISQYHDQMSGSASFQELSVLKEMSKAIHPKQIIRTQALA
jgi:hypothetical protein